MASKFENNLFLVLEKIFGFQNAVKILRGYFGIYFWFKYEPAILLIRLDILRMKFQILINKIKILIYKKLLGEKNEI